MNDTTSNENSGGELTPKQDAGARLDDLNDQRHGERRMEGRQMAGVVESQTQVLRPSASDPGGGFPAAVDGDKVEQAEDTDG